MRKHLAVFIISSCVLLLAGACGTEDLTGSEPTATWDDVVKTRVAQRQNQPTRTPIPTSTPFARLTPTVIGTAGPTPTPTPTFTPEPTPTPNAISAELAPVLLAVEDLPTGWRVSEVSSEIPLTATDNVCGVPVQDPAVAELASGYEGGASGPFAEEYLSLYSSGQNAAAVLEQLQLAFNACPPEGFDYGDGTSGFISPISFPPVGDGSFGVRLGVGVEDLVIEFDMVVFRVDEVLVTVLYQDSAELFGRPPDPAAFEALVRNAEARIHAHTELIDGISAPAQSL